MIRRSVLLLLIGLLLAFGAAPLFMVLRTAFDGGLPRIQSELQETASLAALLETLFLGILVTVIAVPLGASLAWVMTRSDAFDRGRDALFGLLGLPLAIPPYLLAMAWALLANGKSGLLNRPFDAPWIDLYGRDGMVFVLVSAAYPLSMLVCRAALERVDPALEEAARVLGASTRTVLTTVTLPLLAPALYAAAGMIFVFTTAAFGVPYLLGSNADPPVVVLTTRIFRFVSLGGETALSKAAILSVALLLVSAAVQAGLTWLAARRSVVQVGGKASRPALHRLGALRPWVRGAIFGASLLLVVVPIGTIIWTSFLASFADASAMTFDQWRDVLARSETRRAFTSSVALALVSGAIVALVGLWLARLEKQRGLRAISTLAELPYAVPGTVLAIGLLLAFSVEYRLIVLERITFVLALPGTLGLLLIAYVIKHLALGIRNARAGLAQLHPSLEEAARVFGAGPTRATYDVVWPLLRPALLASFVLVALPCLSELTMSVLLFGAGTETTGTLLFELQSYANPPAASVVASLIVVLAIAGDFLARRWRARA